MYLFQITTKDFALQLLTEVTANTVQELQTKAAEMVSRNKKVIGLNYLIVKYTKKDSGTGFDSVTLKTGIITG